MIKICRWCFVFSLALPQSMFAAKQHLAFTVHFYNYARMPAETVARANWQASSVFNAADIALSWVECPTSEKDAPRFRQCSTEPVFIFMRILTHSFETGSQHNRQHLGVASDVSVHVFAERVQNFAEEQRLPVHEVMGAVMAHELGHILLGAGSHSALGIMRPKWRRADFDPASGLLLFTRQQVRSMKASLMSHGF